MIRVIWLLVRNALRAARNVSPGQCEEALLGPHASTVETCLKDLFLTGLDPNPVSRFADMVRRRRGSHGMPTGVVGDGAVVPIADIYGRWLPADVGGLLALTRLLGYGSYKKHRLCRQASHLCVDSKAEILFMVWPRTCALSWKSTTKSG